MLSKFFLFYIITRLTGNPVMALLVILALYYAADRTFFGFIPDPFRLFRTAGRIRELQGLITANPHNARALKELGIFMCEGRKYDKALEYFGRAADKMADDPEFNYYYGISIARSGDIPKGRVLVDSALKSAPTLKYGEPYLAMAEVYMDTGDYQSAQPLLGDFLKIHTSSSRGYYRMAVVLDKLGSREESAEYLRRSVEAFRSAPRYKRKEDRRWAWKARAMLRR